MLTKSTQEGLPTGLPLRLGRALPTPSVILVCERDDSTRSVCPQSPCKRRAPPPGDDAPTAHFHVSKKDGLYGAQSQGPNNRRSRLGLFRPITHEVPTAFS